VIKKTLFIYCILAISSTSCVKDILCIDGNGIVEDQRRNAQAFHQIENSTLADVIYKKADSVSITIKAETNILSHIVTETSNGVLEIRTDPGSACFSHTQQPVITVTSPGLDNLVLTGSGGIIADSLSGNSVSIKLTGSGHVSAAVISGKDLSVTITGSGDIDIVKASVQNSDLRISGSGDINIKGNSDKGNMSISGSGDILADDFLILASTETISGSGNIHTHVANSLTATISGSGNIYLKGNPTITQVISGSGRIIRQ
jgi:hypothetical protein